jgi:hypothetical protein
MMLAQDEGAQDEQVQGALQEVGTVVGLVSGRHPTAIMSPLGSDVNRRAKRQAEELSYQNLEFGGRWTKPLADCLD